MKMQVYIFDLKWKNTLLTWDLKRWHVAGSWNIQIILKEG
jgi:hypothetical protein